MAAPMLQPTKQSSMPSLIYILGGPGVGKGSLCTPLPKEFTNVYHLSVGDHLRDLQAQDSSQSTPQSFGGLDYETFSTLMQQRQLLPTETIVSIVDTALRVIADTAAASGVSNPIVLVDGFPRSVESASLARFLNRQRSSDDSVKIFRMRFDEFEKLNGEILEMYSDIVLRVNTTTETHGETWDGLRGKVGVLMEELGGTKVQERGFARGLE